LRKILRPEVGVAASGFALIAVSTVRLIGAVTDKPWLRPVTHHRNGGWEIVVAFVPYLVALVLVRGAKVPRWLVYGPGLVSAAILLAAPPRGSGDIFVYAFYGKMLVHHVNPLAAEPVRMSADRWYHFISWRRQPSVYGPVWVYVCALAAAIAGSKLTVAVLALKLVSVTGAVIGSVLAARIAGDGDTRRRATLLACLWNPVILFSIAGDGHVEGALFGLVVGALYARHVKRTGVASLLLLVASLIKVYCGLFLLLHLVAVLHERRPSRERRAAHVGVLAAVSAGAYLPLWAGRATFSGIVDIGSRFSATLAWLLRDSIGDVLQPLIGSVRAGQVSSVAVHAFVIAVLGVIVVVAVRHAGRTPDARLWGLAFAGYLLVAPWFLSWHMIPLLGLAFIAWDGPSDSAFAWGALAFSLCAISSIAPIRYGVPLLVFVAAETHFKTHAVRGKPIKIRDVAAIALARATGTTSRALRLGAGETVSGRVAARVSPGLAPRLASAFPDGVVLVSGTNGKTTTAAMIRSIVEAAGRSCAGNRSGSNLFGGVVGGLVQGWADSDLGVFEVDEAALPHVVAATRPRGLLLTNVLRDQLDRFGEPERVTRLFADAVAALPPDAVVVSNADDPSLSDIAGGRRSVTFGAKVQDEAAQAAIGPLGGAEPELCPACASPLRAKARSIAHFGRFTCARCEWSSRDPVVDVIVEERRGLHGVVARVDGERLVLRVGGVHNAYNAAAAIAMTGALGVKRREAVEALSRFRPAFGRGETFRIGDRRVVLTLVKNPAGANSIIAELGDVGAVVLAINDREADGRDVSWIWDIEVDLVRSRDVPVVTAGRRRAEASLLLHSAAVRVAASERRIDRAIELAATMGSPGAPVVVLATYTAMVEVRRSLLGGRTAALAAPAHA